MLQAYSYLESPGAVDSLYVPDFYFHIHCMYNMMALRHGSDPENPPKRQEEQETQGTTQPTTRKLGGSQAAAELQKLSLIKEKASSAEE